MTFGCDTSLLMRILTNYPQPLAKKIVAETFARINRGDEFEISDLVLVEAYYELQASYGLTKTDALKCLKAIQK